MLILVLLACMERSEPVDCEFGEAVIELVGASTLDLVVEVHERHRWVRTYYWNVDGDTVVVDCDDGQQARVSWRWTGGSAPAAP